MYVIPYIIDDMRLSELRQLVRELMRESVIDKDGLERVGSSLLQTSEFDSDELDEYSLVGKPTLREYTKGQIFGGKIKIDGQPVEVEVKLIGADNKKKTFITKIINVDKKWWSKLPKDGILEIPARIFRTPGGGWFKVKTPKVFESKGCGCGCNGKSKKCSI